MRRSVISYMMVVCLLFMSLEGAIDSAIAAQKSQTNGYSHHLDSSDHATNIADHSSGEQSDDHCEDCCHGHTSCPSALSNITAPGDIRVSVFYKQPQFQYLALAPPTPPPTA